MVAFELMSREVADFFRACYTSWAENNIDDTVTESDLRLAFEHVLANKLAKRDLTAPVMESN